LGLANHSSRFP